MAGWAVLRTRVRRWLVAGVVVAMCAVGFGGYRWWNSDSHRAERSLSTVQGLPGVTSTSYDERTHERHVTMSGAASAAQIEATISGMRSSAPDERHPGVLVVGHATGDLSSSAFDAQLGQLLAALGKVPVGGGSISVDATGDPTIQVQLTDSKALAAARSVVAALARSSATSGKFTTVKVWRPRLGSPAVTVESSGMGKSAALLKRLEPLAAWRPILTLAPHGSKLRLNVRTVQDVASAHRQAVRLTEKNTGLSVVVGQGTEKEQTFSGRVDPAQALALTGALGTKARVRSIRTDLFTAEVDTSFAQLRRTATILQQHHVKQATMDVAATDGVGGSQVTDDPATIVRVASGIGRLQTAGYDVNWDATDHTRGNDGPALRVTSSGGIGSPLDEPDHGVAVMRLIRQLGWTGEAALCFRRSDGGTSEEVYFVSTASGRFGGNYDDGSERSRLASAWDLSASGVK